MGKVAALLGVILVMCLVACGGESETVEEKLPTKLAEVEESATSTPLPPTSTPKTLPTSTVNPIPTATFIIKATSTSIPETNSEILSPDTLLQNAFDTMARVETCHFETLWNVTVKAGYSKGLMRQSFQGDYKAPDRLEGFFSAYFAGESVVPETEVIRIAGISYARNPDTKIWEKSKEDVFLFPGALGELLAPSETYQMLEKIEFLREETLETVPVYILEATMPSDVFFGDFGGYGQNLTAVYWVGVDDLLIRKVSLTGGGDGLPLFDPGGNSSIEELTVQSLYTDFGKSVSIEAPIQ